MQISVNNAPLQVSEEANLKDVVESMDLQSTDGIAVAVNQEVIPRGGWESQVLQPDDAVLIITATQGG